jgi:hypothetical protein
MRQPVARRSRMTIIRIAARTRAAVDSNHRDRIHSHDHAAMNRSTVRLALAQRSAARCVRLCIGVAPGRGSGIGIDRMRSRLAQ